MSKISWLYLVSIALLGLSGLASVLIGAVPIDPEVIGEIIWGQISGQPVVGNWPESFAVIVWQVRVPHAILVGLTGAALASSGAAFQGLFRNPLADPYLIGVASGAGLGAVVSLALRPANDALGFLAVPAGAFVGAVITVAVVYQLARVGKVLPITTLILAGVAVGAFLNALTSYLMLRADDQIMRALSFLFGGSPVSGWKPVWASLPYFGVGMIALVLFGHTLNLLQFGDEQAAQLGLPVERAKRWVIAAASLTAAGAVAFSGVIGFIGLVVPHIFRVAAGADYRRLVPLSILGGASALLGADILARTMLAPQTLPVGIITALAGAPFFLWILRRAKIEVFW